MLDTSSPQANAGSQDLAAHAFNLAGIVVLVLLAAVGMAYLIDSAGRMSARPVPDWNDQSIITQTISGVELRIPQSWFRYGEQMREGFTSQVDLQVPIEADGLTAPVPVNVTLLPRSRARTSASLLDAVYLHQFGQETLSGVPGLVGKPMNDSSGYAGESVWYDALSPNPFVAKCLVLEADTGAQQCVRTVYLPSGIAAVYAFDAKLLPGWRGFDAEIARWLGRIGAW